jgi:hypothetical protein
LIWVTRGFTLAPGMANWTPWTMTRSALVRPERIDAQAADQRAGLDRLGGDGVVLADHQHDLARLVGLTRASGTSSAGRPAIGQRMLPNMPGARK